MQGTWCLFVLSGSYDQHFTWVSAEKEDNVFCGSVVPFYLMRGNIFFEELQKFCLLVYNLNTACVFFVHFLDEIPLSGVGYLYRSLDALCCLGHGSFPCSLLWQNMIFRNISGFHFAFPCYNVSFLCKSEKETFPWDAKWLKCDRETLIGFPFHHSTLKANCLPKNVLG